MTNLQVGELFIAAGAFETTSAGGVSLLGLHFLPHMIQLVFHYVYKNAIVDEPAVHLERFTILTSFDFQFDHDEFVRFQSG